MKTPKPKGGRRPGSGRPRVDSVGVNFRLRRETLEWIDAQDGRRSEVIERLINKERGTEMNAVKREHNGKKIVDFKRLPAPIPWGGKSTLEFYAVIDDLGELMVCPVTFAESKSDMFSDLHFDDYGNLKFRDHYLDNSLVSHAKFVDFLQGE